MVVKDPLIVRALLGHRKASTWSLSLEAKKNNGVDREVKLGSIVLFPVIDHLEALETLETRIVAPSIRSRTDIRRDRSDCFSAILNEVLSTVMTVITRGAHGPQASLFISHIAKACRHGIINRDGKTESVKGPTNSFQGIGLGYFDSATATRLGLNNGEHARDGSEEDGKCDELHGGEVLSRTVELSRQTKDDFYYRR